MSSTQKCHDCYVSPGSPHIIGCDVARCLVTGMQAISCRKQHDHGDQVWTGEWPGEADVARLGLASLNELYSYAAQGLITWDRERQGWYETNEGGNMAGPRASGI